MMSPRQMLQRVPVAGGIGVATGLGLIGFETVVHLAEGLVWERLPEAVGVEPDTLWAAGVLAVGGLLVGLVLHLVPGHGGHDLATEGLFGEPPPLRFIPGLLLAAVITLGVGVSMGPEAPLLATTSAVLAWIAARRGLPQQSLVVLGMAGVIGALFGAPVGAAFAFIELIPAAGRELYERLVPLLVASSAGAMTVVLIAGKPQFAAPFPDERAYAVGDVVAVVAIAAVAAVLVLGFGVFLRALYPAVQRIPTIPRLALGGASLGVIVLLVGERVLFSGQRELGELVAEADVVGTGEALLVAVAKLVSVGVALAVGFRGGRIFPVVYAAGALGVALHTLVPGVPLTLAVGGALAGALVALLRVWLLPLLFAALIVGYEAVPFLGLAVVAAWLVVVDRPEVRAERLEQAPALAAE